MPMYEYECSNCSQILEIIQKFSDPALTECPNCKGRIQKLISRASFHLKGSGWYATDYKKSTSTSTPTTNNESKNTETTTPATPASTSATGCGSGPCANNHGGNTKT